MSIFKMKHGYRQIGKYISFLHKKLIKIQSLYPKDDIRIYYDLSIKNDAVFKKLVSQFESKQIKFVEYNIPQLRDGDFHYGTTGTLVRYFPLFEKSEYEYIWIMDVDTPDYYLNPSVFKLDFEIMFGYFTDYIVSKASAFRSGNYLYGIVADFFLSKVRFPKRVLTKFINDISTGLLDDTIKKINELNSEKHPDPIFPYGMDELFLNRYLRPYMLKHRLYMKITNGLLRLFKSKKYLANKELSKLDMKNLDYVMKLEEYLWRHEDPKILDKFFHLVDITTRSLNPLYSPVEKQVVSLYYKFWNSKSIYSYAPISKKEMMIKV